MPPNFRNVQCVMTAAPVRVEVPVSLQHLSSAVARALLAIVLDANQRSETDCALATTRP